MSTLEQELTKISKQLDEIIQLLKSEKNKDNKEDNVLRYDINRNVYEKAITP